MAIEHRHTIILSVVDGLNSVTFMNYAMTKNTRIMLNAGLDYGDIRSERLQEYNHGWQASAFLGLQQTLPLGTEMECFSLEE